MPPRSNHLLYAVLLASLCACSVYEKHGYGWVARSRLPPAEVTPLKLPAEAPSISQRYRPVVASTSSDHRGFDILVPSNTPVLAAAAGRVERVSTSLLFGRQIMLNHGRTGAGFRLQTRYFHLAEQLVSENQVVSRGQLLGYSGLSGMAGLYPHLHFEVHRLDDATPPRPQKYLDPQLFWVDGIGQVTCYDSSHQYEAEPVRLTYPVPCLETSWQ